MSPIKTEISSSSSTDSVQSFLAVLQKCHSELFHESEGKSLCPDQFDPLTGTLTISRFDCSKLDDEDFEKFHVLHQVIGDMVIRDNHAITNLEGLRNLEIVSGALTVTNLGLTCLRGLNRLRLTGGLFIDQMPFLKEVSGLTALERITGNCRISGNSKLVSINGFTGLRECRGDLQIHSNQLLEQIYGFTALTTIDDGGLEISDNPVLVTVAGMLALDSIGSTLSITNCPELSDFRFLTAVRSVGNLEINYTKIVDGAPLQRLFRENPSFKGSIRITQNEQLTDLSFMEGLVRVGSSLYLHQNSLANLKGLERLRRVGASFNLSANKLEHISHLSNLEEIDGILGLSFNRLRSLHGLENLRSIRTKKWGNVLLSIKINDNRHPDGSISLEDISALANVREVSGQLIVFADGEEEHKYRLKPAVNSVFHTGNKSIQVYGRNSKTVLPISHIIDGKKEVRTPVLFPDMSQAWQNVIRQCERITPHFQPFTKVDEMVGYCRAHGITIVVGIKLTSQKFLAANKDNLRRHGLRFMVNDPKTIDNCENKIAFQRFMVDNGYGDFVPRYFNNRRSIKYPCIVKPEYGSFGSGQRIIYSEEELQDLPGNFVVSEYIAGRVEYASHIFFLDRKNYWHVTYKKTYDKSYFILGQEKEENLSSQAVETPYLDLFLNILDDLHFSGICCIDYKPVNNQPKIFEINARTGYSLASHPHDFRQMLDRYIACTKIVP